MTWREAHEEAMFAAADAHEELEVDPTRRIDVFEGVRQCGIDLIFRPLRGLSGLYVPSIGAERPPGMLVSSNHREARQRFTAAHELGHFWFHHEGSVDLEAEAHARPDLGDLNPQEMLAEAFAAWFLMPPELVDSALEELRFGDITSPAHVYVLSLHLGTSYRATLSQLPNLKLLDRHTAISWASQPVKGLKEQVSANIAMPDYAADVHVLDLDQSPRTMHLQTGDRLVLCGQRATLEAFHSLNLPACIADVVPVQHSGRLIGLEAHSSAFVLDLAHNPEDPSTITLSSRQVGAEHTAHIIIHRPRFGRYRPSTSSDVVADNVVVGNFDRNSS